MKRTIFFVIAAALILILPLSATAAARTDIYEPSWQKIDIPANFTLNIDAKSIVRAKDTGIVSFFIEKTYDEDDVHDGEILTVAGRIDYNPQDGTYWVRSLNYIRKNSKDSMDAHAFYEPDWRRAEEGTAEAAACEAAMKHLAGNAMPLDAEEQN